MGVGTHMQKCLEKKLWSCSQFPLMDVCEGGVCDGSRLLLTAASEVTVGITLHSCVSIRAWMSCLSIFLHECLCVRVDIFVQ